MKLISQSAQCLPQQAGIDGIYKAIELAGRTSYLSWNKMTDDSAKKFVDMLIKSKHTSVLEHGTVYLSIPITTSHAGFSENHYRDNPYSKFNESQGLCMTDEYGDKCDCWCITTNLRVLQENSWLDDLQYLREPTEFHEKRLSVKVITDIGVTREFNRHRTFSIVEQSTRYCNFSKDKFGNEITFIKPVWFDSFTEKQKESYSLMLQDAETAYFTLLDTWENRKPDRRYKTGFKGNPLTPQQARQVLPLCTKTEVVYTAFESDWRHFFDLRLFGKTGEPHPQMKQLAELIKQEFEKAGVWEGIMKYPSKYD